ncbi:MAG: lipid II flippase MurJ, partial [Nitrosomonas sp.]|nr:lipid II flippase MurJ [Nitrosomonas sp.]
TPLITTLFYYGAFTVEDVWMTREALIAYSVGLLGLILVKVLAPGFYARQNIKTPVKVAILTLVATQLMNLVFIIPLKHAGLALAIGLGACLNAGVLYSKLRSQRIYQPLPGWGSFIFKILVALIVMGAGLWLAAGNSAEWFLLTATERAVKLGLVVTLGGVGYFACLWMLGFRLRDFARQ